MKKMNKMSERLYNATALNEIKKRSPCATNTYCLYIIQSYSKIHTVELTYSYKLYSLKDILSPDHTPLKLYDHVAIQRSRDHTTINLIEKQ